MIFRMVKASIHRDSIISLYRGGVSAPDIQKRLGVNKTVVYRTIQRFAELGTVAD